MSTTTLNRSSSTLKRDVNWILVSSQIGAIANSWAGRFDIVAYVGSNAGHNNPACFVPATAELEINVDKCFGTNVKPADVLDLSIRANQFDWPRVVGAVFHEAMHARFSTWDIPSAAAFLTRAELNALLLLEEGRIEKLGLDIFPRNAGFLRSMALEIVLSNLQDEAAATDTGLAACAAALALARVDAGSLEEEDVEVIRDAVLEKVPADELAKLRELWLAAQSCNGADIVKMYDIAREWAKIVNDLAEKNGDKPDTSGEPSDFMDRLTDAIDESADMAKIGAYADIEDTGTLESWESAVEESAKDAKSRAEAAKVASEVFGSGTKEVSGTPTASSIVETRAPSAAERASAVKIAKLLEKAKYRDRSETEVTSIVPPGRLRTRAALQGAALRSKGVISATEPWRRTVRKHVDDPTLRIGIMVDISGSMGAAMQPMATTAWVLSEAVRRAQGTAAMVYYGNSVFPTLKPGQRLDKVTVYTALDMTEKFSRAFKALDGSMNLLHGTGARMLVIVSDGEYTSTETGEAKRVVAECERAGVAVLWITFDGRFMAARTIIKGHKAQLVNVSGSAVNDAAIEIGRAAARALEAAA